MNATWQVILFKNTFHFVLASVLLGACAAPAATPAQAEPEQGSLATPVSSNTQTATSQPEQNSSQLSRVYFCQENPQFADAQFKWRSFDVYAIRSDGSEKSALTSNTDKDVSFTSLSVSPDGTMLAFARMRLNRERGVLISHLYVMNTDGTGMKKVGSEPVADNQNEVADYLYETSPAWSADGKMLAFVSNRHTFMPGERNHDALEIFTLTLESGLIKQVTFSKGFIDRPSWSPDGEQFAFMSNRTGYWNIFSMNADGSGEAFNLTSNPSAERWPAWSPNGERIAFHSNQPGSLDVYTIRPDGGGLTRVTDYPGNDFSPVWSPDGGWLAFLSDMGGTDEIYLRDLESGSTFQLTTDGTPKAWIAWGR